MSSAVGHVCGYGSPLPFHFRPSSTFRFAVRPSIIGVPSQTIYNVLKRPANLGRDLDCSTISKQRSSTATRLSLGELFELSAEVVQGIEGADGPIEIPMEMDPFAIPETTPLQAVASILLTGTITVLLYRSIRRRSKRAKEMKFRSTGEESVKSINEEARKAAILGITKAPEVEVPRPSALATLSGALVAGSIALVLYKFTTTVEGGFVGKVVSTNYSIRNLTVTVRTILTGLCYLATFVFAANSIGLTLYSLQLALNSNLPSSNDSRGIIEPPSSSPTNDSVETNEERGSE